MRRRRLQIKTPFFHQESAKSQGLVTKFKVALRQASVRWLFGGFLVHNCRSVLNVGVVSWLWRRDVLRTVVYE